MSAAGVDPDAARYDAHWRPVLDGATERLVARLDPRVRRHLDTRSTPLLLDVGAGTGALLVRAGLRWPRLGLAAIDTSAAMLRLARQRAEAAGLDVADDDAAWLVGDAASIAMDDGAASVAASSFVLQLVADRAAVLREMRRVLSPGGTFGFVTWLAEDSLLDADAAFDDAVYELQLDEPDAGFRVAKAGDFESAQAAADEVSAAGFGTVDARPDELVRTWTRESFLAFKEEYDELDLFESLGAEERAALLGSVRRRYAELPDEAFVWRAPLVSVVAVA